MESVWTTLEKPFELVGLNTPLSRFLAASLVAGVAEFLIRPSYSYQANGNPRPWSILDPAAATGTLLPPGSTAILTGAFFGLII